MTAVVTLAHEPLCPQSQPPCSSAGPPNADVHPARHGQRRAASAPTGSPSARQRARFADAPLSCPGSAPRRSSGHRSLLNDGQVNIAYEIIAAQYFMIFTAFCLGVTVLKCILALICISDEKVDITLIHCEKKQHTTTIV
ncbi:hypothetical protein RB195_011223 [Necator americanus]